MKTLTLEHLAPYLPYGLKQVYTGNTEHLGVTNHLISEIHPSNIMTLVDSDTLNKPMLRPLSDLTKEIEQNGEKFVPMVELLKLAHESYYKEKIGTRYQEIEFEQTPIRAKACFSFMATKDLELYTLMPWNFPTWMTQKLLSWHFDVFGLIEQGLAIDINTLEK